MRKTFAPMSLENNQIGIDFVRDADYCLRYCPLSCSNGVYLVLHSGKLPGSNLLKPGSRALLCERMFVLDNLGLSDSAQPGHDIQQMQGCAVVGRELFGHAKCE
jgi:hypothetical protein